MLQVLPRLEEQLTRVNLGKDARHGPYITLFIPVTVLKDNLRRSVLPRRDYIRMALVGVSCPSEVDQFNVTGERL